MINKYRVGNIVKFNNYNYYYNHYTFYFNGDLGEIVKIKHYKEESSYSDAEKPFHTEIWVVYNGDQKAILTTEYANLSDCIENIFDNKESAEV